MGGDGDWGLKWLRGGFDERGCECMLAELKKGGLSG